MTRNRSGFTLIELMIAFAILSLVAVFGYRALASLTDSEVRLASEAQRWRTLDALFARLEADMREALPRAVRNGNGTEPAWLGDIDGTGNAVVRFSRAGPEFAAEPGSAGQRIGYRLRGDVIEILYWPRLDQPASVTPQPFGLASGVAAFRIVYLDARNTWRDRWPAMGDPPMPRAVRVAVTLAGGEQIERWLALR